MDYYQRVFVLSKENLYAQKLQSVLSVAGNMICMGVSDQSGISRISAKLKKSEIVIFDISSYNLSELIRLKQIEGLKIIVVGGSCERIEEYMSYGINGYLSNKESYFDLLNCITTLKDHEFCFDEKFLTNLFSEGKRNLQTDLTPREYEVLNELAKSQSFKQISEKLQISTETVKTHLDHVYSKLGVNSRYNAVHKARITNLIS